MNVGEGSKPGTESRGRITDARGRKVTQLDPATLHLLHRHDIIEAEALEAIAKDIGPGVPRGQKLFFWISTFLGASALVIAALRAFAFHHGLDVVGRVLWAITIVCLCLGLFKIWQRGRRGRFQRVQRIMLRHRRCPHCGYDLVGLPVSADDGATVCPECGGAWMIEHG